MSALATGPGARLEELTSALASYREMVASRLRGAHPGGEPRRYLYGLIDEHLARDGKGLRPALCLATCGAFGGAPEEAVPVAAGLEMLHNAFLVHDDIEDGSLLRRDRPTLHAAEGIPLAINVGDAMQALSVRLVREGAEAFGPVVASRMLDELDHLLMESLEGQAWEIGWVRDNVCDVTADDYLRMTLKKTCWYSFIHPCRLGALIARRQDLRSLDLDSFNRFGFLLGAAFQIQDDVLNLVGDQTKYGKESGGDLWEGKRTLILIDLFARLPAFQAARLKGILGKPRGSRVARDVMWMREMVDSVGSLASARQAARELAEAARLALETLLDPLPATPHRDFLRDLVSFVVTRES